MVSAPLDTDRRLRSRSVVAGAIFAALVVASGCTSGTPQDVGGGGGKGGNPPGQEAGVSCLRDEPGCACKHEGAVIQCGVAAYDDGGRKGAVKCAMGGEICNGGRWSTCQTNSNDPALQSSEGLKLVTGVTTKALTNPGISCTNNPCDPYCMQYPDNANGVNPGDAGVSTLGCGDASVLTVVTSGSPEASTAPPAVLRDAALADGESVIYIDLPPGQTATRSFITPQATIKNADIYFLIDDGSNMGAAASNLAGALTGTTSGIIQELRALLSSGTNFGVGRYEDYYWLPYNSFEGTQQSSTNPYNVPFQNLLSIQSDTGANFGFTANAVDWMTVDAFLTLNPSNQYFARSGGDIPESAVSALWATSTGNGLFTDLGSPSGDGTLTITGTNNANPGGQSWYTTPRQAWNGTSYVPYWLGSPMAVAGTDIHTAPNANTFPGPTSEQMGGGVVPCNLATTTPTYPCFRQSSTPVVVMMSSAPSHNGPGGQYPYVQSPSATYSPTLAGANSWPIQPVAGCIGALNGYGGPVAGGGSMCQILHDPATGNTGTSFATAIPLPTAAAGTPLPGVYYGVVPNANRPAGDVGGPDWFSGSSVGAGAFTFPSAVAAGAVSKWVPGAPQRSSLRDCSATDAVQCTPSMTSGTTYPTDCYNNTSTAASTTTLAAVAAGNSTYTPTNSPITSTAATLYTSSAITELATLNTLAVAGASGGAGALATETATTYSLQNVAIPTVNQTATIVADSYTAGPTITLASTIPPYKIPVTSGTYTLPGSIPIPAGDELSNVTVTVNAVVAGYDAVVTAAASVGGITTGTVTAPPANGSSTASGVYYAGTTAVSGVTFSVTQNANASYTTTYTTSPVEPVNYVEVTVTYQINTPNACATGMYNEPITYGSAGTSATAECPVCPTGFPYNAGAGQCQGPQCPGGTTIGNGSDGTVATKCYSCTGGAALNTGTNPWSCTSTCAGTGYTLGTGANVGNCYKCSAGTLSNGATPTCGYTCASGTLGVSPENTTDCYSCPNSAALITTTNPWTCADTCAGAGYTLGTAPNALTNTCYTCTGATNGAGNTALTLDKQSSPWNCASCPTTTSTPTAGPALDKLITSTNPYTCDGCPTTLYTLNTAGTQCTPTTVSCSAGYSVSGANCVATSACLDSQTGSTSSGAAGVGCSGLPVCPSPASSTTQNCYTKTQTSSANPPGVCTCAETTYTAGTATTATCTTGVATMPNQLAAGNSCSTAGNGNACAVATGAACTAYAANTGYGGISCQVPAVSPVPQCTTDGLAAGDGYYGNDQIFSFTVPAGSGFGSRYYYHFALLREAAYLPPSGGVSVPGNWLTGAAPGTAGTVLANAAGGYIPKPFLYIKSAGGFSVNPLPATPTDTSYPFSILSTESASDTGSTLPFAGPNGPVLDCNISAMVSDGVNSYPPSASSPNGQDYILSEIDGYLPAESTATTYYLVVDNAGPTSYTASLPSFQYFLQVGGFDDAPTNTSVPTYTQPSYTQMIAALNGIQAKFVGVENSGLSCFQPGDSFTQDYSQYETRDFMDKVAYDVGSYDSTTTPIRPYVVPVRKDGTSCNITCPASLTAQAAGNACTGACLTSCATWGAATCATQYPLSPIYDASTQSCTKGCATNGDCPMNTPICTPGAPSNYCTTVGCPGGVSGLSCAVASAVTNLTNNLKQDVYLRPISVNAGSTYTAPGATCTPTTAGMPASAQCTGMSTGGTECYGGSCTTTCLVSTDCTSGLCEPSTYPGDTNKYCISPAVFIESVAAVSTNTGMTGSETVCGIHPKTLPCAIDSNCPPSLPTCLTSGPAVSTCGINDTGPDTIVPLPSYYTAGSPPQDNDGMFNYCSPGSTVQFNVTFIMPFQRSQNAQQYEFDLGIYAGAGIIGRTRVILENPALAVSDFYRDYDGNTVCPGGTHVVWGNFSYNALCPSDGVGDYSQIRFCATSATSADAGFGTLPASAQDGTSGCAPGEVLLGIATANENPTSMTSLDTVNTCPANGNPGMGYPCSPKNPAAAAAVWTTCTGLTTTPTCTANAACQWAPQLGFNVGTVLAANAVAADAGLASDQYLRIRMEFDPSVPGDVVAPFLYSWNLDVDCIPSE
jgi:hypothetical protein